MISSKQVICRSKHFQSRLQRAAQPVYSTAFGRLLHMHLEAHRRTEGTVAPTDVTCRSHYPLNGRGTHPPSVH
jgi:hypothetical protein